MANPGRDNSVTERPPIPVERLVEQVCDDGVDGYCGGTFDPETGILSLRFDRDTNTEGADVPDWGTAEYHFQLIPSAPSEVTA